eukprot:bmy_19297T0
MRHRSLARELSGTIKEILGTTQSVGCSVHGRHPQDIIDDINSVFGISHRIDSAACIMSMLHPQILLPDSVLPGLRSSEKGRYGLVPAGNEIIRFVLWNHNVEAPGFLWRSAFTLNVSKDSRWSAEGKAYLLVASPQTGRAE